jgi:thioredoxin reductase (NADPH)
MERNGRLRVYSSTVVREIRPNVVILQKGSDTIEAPADSVLLLTGYVQDPDLFEQAGVALTGPGRKPLINEMTMETNVPGVYVAGTAVAGTQSFGVKEFIETSHVHVDRIVAAITGAAAPEREAFEMPET